VDDASRGRIQHAFYNLASRLRDLRRSLEDEGHIECKEEAEEKEEECEAEEPSGLEEAVCDLHDGILML
jgi:hypothetical protein